MRRSELNRWRRLPVQAAATLLLCGTAALYAQSPSERSDAWSAAISIAAQSGSSPCSASSTLVARLHEARPAQPATLPNDATDALPDAPTPESAASQENRQATRPGFPPVSPTPGPRLPEPGRAHPEIPSTPAVCLPNLSTPWPNDLCCARRYDSFQRFLNATDIHPLTPRQKGRLAFRNTVDPYNFATIAFNSAVSVASDADSPYGPGFPGFARNFGVAYTENAVSEFFGTFLIPSLTHQDPHYHRLPNASYQRRVLHAITQVVWAQDDYGRPVPNYSTLLGSGIDGALSNLYVPGRDTSAGATANRYLTGIATDPIGNFITEFVPDVARRVNIHIVLIQGVIDRVERNP
jgi:hypothetical protein